MVYLDTNVIFYPIVYAESLQEYKTAFTHLESLVKGDICGCVCLVAWSEIVNEVARLEGPALARRAGDALFGLKNLQFVPLSRQVISAAQQITAKYNVLPREAVHAACAIKYCNGEIISDNPRFDEIDGIKRTF